MRPAVVVSILFFQLIILFFIFTKLNEVKEIENRILDLEEQLVSRNSRDSVESQIIKKTKKIDIYEISDSIDRKCETIRKGWLDVSFDTNDKITLNQITKGKLELISLHPFSSFPSNFDLKDGNDKSYFASPFPDIQLSPRFRGLEFRCYSQNSEDGILISLFNTIGVTNKKVVEVCSGVGWENNAAFLITNFGFKGILMDGDDGNAKKARAFFSSHPNTRNDPPVFLNTFVTAENINELIEQNGFYGEIDLFSLDMDGVDYWIWDALTVVQPRVVVVETQEVWGWDKYKTRPYRPDHVSRSIPEMGASIMAFVHLEIKLGYRLVGCIELGFNAFFVRNDIGVETLGESYDPKGCFWHWTPDWVKVIEDRRIVASSFDWVDPRHSSRQLSIRDAITGLD